MLTTRGVLIVSRHPAAIEFIRKAASLPEEVLVMAHATEDDVRGRLVYGNLPMHLASLADAVVAVEFTGTPPRGFEYGLAEMEAAGARLVCYVVSRGPHVVLLDDGEDGVRHLTTGDPEPNLAGVFH